MTQVNETFARHEARNYTHSILLIGIMVLICSALGWLMWGTLGLIMLALFTVLLMTIGPKLSPQLIFKMYRARKLSDREAPVIIQIVEELSRRANLHRVPQIYYLPSRMINAFTVGTKYNAAIGLTDGLIRNLTTRELSGVLAHEISHAASNDLWVMGLADMVSQLVRAMSWIGFFLLLIHLPMFMLGLTQIPWLFILLLIVAPNLTVLLQLALSRTREYDADLDAVKLTSDPRGLAMGLAKLEKLQGNLFERIFFPGRRVPEPSVLRTHPVTEDRIRRLLELESAITDQPLNEDDRLLKDLDWTPPPSLRSPRWHISGFWY
jgi:heat shock protein HtpX